MRTTVTLDPDVAAALQEAARRLGTSFKETLNNAVRAGLAVGRQATTEYELPSFRLGARPGVDLDHALRLAGELDDEELAGRMDRAG